MRINTASLITFSPTRTTRRIVEAIADGLLMGNIESLDLTLPEADTRTFDLLENTIAVVGVPVYGGRVPKVASERLQRLRARHSPTILVVVYGNRAFEDALLELRELVVARGLTPVAGAAFIGEHSFSSDAMPIAAGRPDKPDLTRARVFGATVRQRIQELSGLDEPSRLSLPGNVPYRAYPQLPKVVPFSSESSCTRCGTGATVCPTGAISSTDPPTTDPERCILCCACVKACPTGARVMRAPEIQEFAKRLNKNCAERREPETFL